MKRRAAAYDGAAPSLWGRSQPRGSVELGPNRGSATAGRPCCQPSPFWMQQRGTTTPFFVHPPIHFGAAISPEAKG
jgi:hypothetical protein